ncbi:MAG: hypothetical protein HN348_30160, partial [Proteobacteria bacterium]|nr:hypothetical protein [Pseudomonadota bacterium]
MHTILFCMALLLGSPVEAKKPKASKPEPGSPISVACPKPGDVVRYEEVHSIDRGGEIARGSKSVLAIHILEQDEAGLLHGRVDIESIEITAAPPPPLDAVFALFSEHASEFSANIVVNPASAEVEVTN